ncbi:MAG: TerB family tellurite resistance protein [SAR324 cluster bacterium]|nr:TerB family tellurite resistance protein [SAR324 cluster bacterium]
MFFKKMVDRFKENVLAPELTFSDAKVLAMLAVIHSDEKDEMKREMGLMEALCAFDQRLAGIAIPDYVKQFTEYGKDLDFLFEKLEDSMLSRDDKMDLLASVYLLASIDGYISKEETQILHRLAKTLRMTLEDIQTVEEHSKYITDTLNKYHLLDHETVESSSTEISLSKARILAMLAVIHSDEKSDVSRELGLMRALYSFDRSGEKLDFQEIQSSFEEYANNMDRLFQVLLTSITEKSAKFDVFSSAFLLAAIDGDISDREIQFMDRLADTLNLTDDEVVKIRHHSHSLIATMKELRILS